MKSCWYCRSWELCSASGACNMGVFSIREEEVEPTAPDSYERIINDLIMGKTTPYSAKIRLEYVHELEDAHEWEAVDLEWDESHGTATLLPVHGWYCPKCEVTINPDQKVCPICRGY